MARTAAAFFCCPIASLKYLALQGMISPRRCFLTTCQRSTITAMKTEAVVSNAGAAIWQRVLEFDGQLSPTAARALLKLRFAERDQALLDELSAKARASSLTPDEQTQLDTFERLGCLLDMLHSKA